MDDKVRKQIENISRRRNQFKEHILRDLVPNDLTEDEILAELEKLNVRFVFQNDGIRINEGSFDLYAGGKVVGKGFMGWVEEGDSMSYEMNYKRIDDGN